MIAFEYRASIILYNYVLSTDRDKVFLVPANVCPIVIMTYLKAVRKYEFVDISPDTLCIDEGAVIGKLKKNPDKYSGVHFVRTYGTMRSFESFFRGIKNVNNDFIIIDDKCLTMPDLKEDKITCADLVLFSTGYSKYVDIGWGGYGFVKGNKACYKKEALPYKEQALERLTAQLKLSIDNGKVFKYKDSDWLGDTSFSRRFTSYQKLISKKTVEMRKVKQSLNGIYREQLPKEIQLGKEFEVWRFNILVKDKKSLLKKIFSQKLFASSHYYPMTHVFGGVKAWSADRLYGSVINLFNDRRFDEEKTFKICEIINKHVA